MPREASDLQWKGLVDEQFAKWLLVRTLVLAVKTRLLTVSITGFDLRGFVD